MGVVKEWDCKECGNEFDSDLPICPRCGSVEPVRAFRTAPSYKGDKTKAKDSSLQEFASFYGLTDFSNNQNTKHEKKTDHLWKPASSFDSSVSGGEAGLIKSLTSTAGKYVKNPKIVGSSK